MCSSLFLSFVLASKVAPVTRLVKSRPAPPAAYLEEEEEARTRSGGSPARHFRHLEGRKRGKIIVVFPRLTSIRRVCFRPVNGTFLQILGVPTGEKTRRNQANIPKRRLSRLGYDPFFLRKFRFLCPFGVKKAAIPRPGSLHLGGTRGGL